MDKKLIKESLEHESSFSSNTHAIDTITKDVNTDGIVDYDIPLRYNQLKLVFMPVNKTKYYFYWDFPQQFLHQNIASIEDISFHIVDQEHNMLADIKCPHELGEYFYTLEAPAKTLKVIAVYKHGIRFMNLIESNSVKVFNSEILYANKDVFIEKRKGFTEVIRASMNHFTIGMSSKNYVDEIRRLEEYSNISTQGLSSDGLGGK
jgi:hypothetical protein